MNKNQSIKYPITEIPWETKNVFFFPIFNDIFATVGITKKVVDKAPILPKRVGQRPAASVLPSNR